MGEVDQAENAYRRVLSLDPNQLIALNNLGTLLMHTYRYSEAVGYFKRARTQRPSDSQLMFNLRMVIRGMGIQNKLRLCMPNWQSCVLKIRTLGGTICFACGLRDGRRDFTGTHRLASALKQLEQMIADTHEPNPWVEGLLSAFYMHYSCEFDRDIQGAYGAVVQRLMRKAAPQWCQPMYRRSTVGRRIRVGVVSSYLRKHTVAKLFKGWFQSLNDTRYELVGFHLGDKCDGTTDELRAAFHRFEHCPSDWKRAAQLIREANLDVIVYPEVGMDADTIKMAALRLAPLQCMAWGHPVTTGLSTMDVFISSEMMEPLDGETRYYERLVRLPGLGISYARPEVPPPGDILSELGLNGGTLYLCCQSLNKYLPRHDWVWPAIAAQVSDARFVFLKLPGDSSTRRFEARLEGAFLKKGLDWRQYCTILPRLSEESYLRLNGAADVYLDGVSWSGGNTSLEAIAYGTPVVSCQGQTMRERHTAAMMSMMGLSQWVADDVNGFVENAVKLGCDSALRMQFRQQIRSQSHVLFDATDSVRALETFFENEMGTGAPSVYGFWVATETPPIHRFAGRVRVGRVLRCKTHLEIHFGQFTTQVGSHESLGQVWGDVTLTQKVGQFG